jgi:hypothetical protein
MKYILIPLVFLCCSFSTANLAPIFDQVSTEYSVSAELLSKIADIESNFDPKATTSTSSAKGLYQIISSTENWLREMCDITGDVFDPLTNTRLGACYINYNTKYFSRKMGRLPTFTESYSMHFFGAWTAVKFIRLVKSAGSELACKHFKRESRANRGVFYKPSGEPRTLSEVYRFFEQKIEKARVL